MNFTSVHVDFLVAICMPSIDNKYVKVACLILINVFLADVGQASETPVYDE